MNKIKILVVEDEAIIADSICLLLEDLGYDPLEPAMDYEEAIELLREESPDFVMLDIQLAGKKDGIDVAREIKDNYRIPFIFLTSNADPMTMERAKSVTPGGYLVKPFNSRDLYTSIELALHNYHTYSESQVSNREEPLINKALFIKEKGLYFKVAYCDIAYIKSDHVYIEIYTIEQRKFVMRASLQTLLQKLPPYFCRTHRSYAVNLQHLAAVNSAYVIIQEEQIPVGNTYRDALINQLDIKF